MSLELFFSGAFASGVPADSPKIRPDDLTVGRLGTHADPWSNPTNDNLIREASRWEFRGGPGNVAIGGRRQFQVAFNTNTMAA